MRKYLVVILLFANMAYGNIYDIIKNDDVQEFIKIAQGSKNKDLYSYLRLAIKDSRYQIAHYLFHKGLTPNLNPPDSPLLVAIYNKDHEMLRLLKYHGANPNHQDDMFSLLYYVMIDPSSDRPTKLLLEAGADPNNKVPGNLLHLAIKSGLSSRLKLLLEYGANPHIRDDNGYNALDVAIAVGDARAISIIKGYM